MGHTGQNLSYLQASFKVRLSLAYWYFCLNAFNDENSVLQAEDSSELQSWPLVRLTEPINKKRKPFIAVVLIETLIV